MNKLIIVAIVFASISGIGFLSHNVFSLDLQNYQLFGSFSEFDTPVCTCQGTDGFFSMANCQQFMGNYDDPNMLCVWEAGVEEYGDPPSSAQGCEANFWKNNAATSESSIVEADSKTIWPPGYSPDYYYNDMFHTTILSQPQNDGGDRDDDDKAKSKEDKKESKDDKKEDEINRNDVILEDETNEEDADDENETDEDKKKSKDDKESKEDEINRNDIVLEDETNEEDADDENETDDGKKKSKDDKESKEDEINRNDVILEDETREDKTDDKNETSEDEDYDPLRVKDKVIICHKGNTIEIDSSAVPSHQRHGDIVGACQEEDLGPTLLEALNSRDGNMNALLRQSVAALLNAAHSDVNYPHTVVEVITMTQIALSSGEYDQTASMFEEFNEKAQKPPLCQVG